MLLEDPPVRHRALQNCGRHKVCMSAVLEEHKDVLCSRDVPYVYRHVLTNAAQHRKALLT
jgi:hypothetical protein